MGPRSGDLGWVGGASAWRLMIDRKASSQRGLLLTGRLTTFSLWLSLYIPSCDDTLYISTVIMSPHLVKNLEKASFGEHDRVKAPFLFQTSPSLQLCHHTHNLASGPHINGGSAWKCTAMTRRDLYPARGAHGTVTGDQGQPDLQSRSSWQSRSLHGWTLPRGRETLVENQGWKAGGRGLEVQLWQHRRGGKKPRSAVEPPPWEMRGWKLGKRLCSQGNGVLRFVFPSTSLESGFGHVLWVVIEQ